MRNAHASRYDTQHSMHHMEAHQQKQNDCIYDLSFFVSDNRLERNLYCRMKTPGDEDFREDLL